MRVATWNLDHAYNASRPTQLQINKIVEINPDIIVLTETCENVSLQDYGYTVSYPEQKNGHEKYCVAIWSRHPILSSPFIQETMLAVCAEIDSPLGKVLVYGTIIPYHGYKGLNGKSSIWEEHYKAIEKQGSDWTALLNTFKNKPLIVAGDFNQTRDRSKQTYGTEKGRQLLSDQLTQNKLVCLTEENFGDAGKLSIDPKKGKVRNNIDHICTSKSFLKPHYVGAWDHFNHDNLFLSDHNGVYVDFEEK